MNIGQGKSGIDERAGATLCFTYAMSYAVLNTSIPGRDGRADEIPLKGSV